jgi:hypothetical protein
MKTVAREDKQQMRKTQIIFARSTVLSSSPEKAKDATGLSRGSSRCCYILLKDRFVDATALRRGDSRSELNSNKM